LHINGNERDLIAVWKSRGMFVRSIAKKFGRPEAFPVGFFRGAYIPMQESREKWDEVTATNDIQWAFVALTDATPWFRLWWQMIKQHPDWKIVYFDNFSAVLVKVDSQNNLIGSQGKAKILELLQ